MKRLFFALILFVLMIFPSLVSADTAGPGNPNTVAENQSEGATAWTDYSHVQLSDNSYTAVTLPISGQSYFIHASGFTFNVPTGAAIQGITLEIEKRADSGNIKDATVKLTKNGVIVGDDQADTSTGWPVLSDQYRLHGGASNLWGASFTPAEINSQLGVVISAQNDDSTLTHEAKVDHVRATITFAAPAPMLPRRYVTKRISLPPSEIFRQTSVARFISTQTKPPASADDIGLLSPTLVRQQQAENEKLSTPWDDISNVLSSDDKYATVTLNEAGFRKGSMSYLLCVSGFGFNLPDGATVLGIEARVEKRAESSSIRDLCLSLIVNGTVTGGLKVDSSKGWPVIADAVRAHGGPTDLWGLEYPGRAPTPANINSSDFGMAICIVNFDGLEQQREAGIDHIAMEVYFKLPLVPKQIAFFANSEIDLLATIQIGQPVYKQSQAPKARYSLHRTTRSSMDVIKSIAEGAMLGR